MDCVVGPSASCGKSMAIDDAITCALKRSVLRLGGDPKCDNPNLSARAVGVEEGMERTLVFRTHENDAWQFNEY